MESAPLSPDQLLTLGQLAARLHTSVHQLKYALDRYRVEPRTRIGITRCWCAQDLPAIRSALARVESNRKGTRR